ALRFLCRHPHARDLESLLTISPSIYGLPLDRFHNVVSFEEELVYQRLRKTLTHVLELSSCIYLDDRALEVLNFDSTRMRILLNPKTTPQGKSVTPQVDKPKPSAVTPLFKNLHASMPSYSIPQPREFNVVKHRNVIALGMFKINPSQTPWVVKICLWCVDSDCSKHMTGNIKLLINFVWKFLGTIRFGNDHIAAILGYGDLKWGNITITRVYFVEGKSKRASHPPKPVPNSKQQLHLLHMDLCGPMRVASINGK
nr:integrase, catalytic region, zinc finger, CCHC-type, peptidase aspartic, catalytic [Tanacetum cinerariifolium]